VKLAWSPRLDPLPPAGAYARGGDVMTLLERARGRPGLRGVAGDDFVVLLGDVPWVHGVTWIGREPQAPGLWTPTRQAFAPHPALVLRALRDEPLPVLLMPDRRVPLAAARPLTHEGVRAWLQT
jgi:hypothetical protein